MLNRVKWPLEENKNGHAKSTAVRKDFYKMFKIPFACR